MGRFPSVIHDGSRIHSIFNVLSNKWIILIMVQIILTYVIVALAVMYVLRKVILLFSAKSNNGVGCGGACSCSAKQQFANAKKNKRK